MTSKHRPLDGRSKKDPLSTDDLERAIYIDFDGPTDKAYPTFLGIECEDEWGVVVVDTEFRGATEHGFGKGEADGTVAFDSLHGVLHRLRYRSEAEHRGILAWSNHEIEMIELHSGVDADDLQWWKDNLINAKLVAERWAVLKNVEVEPRPSRIKGKTTTGSLESYLDLIGYNVPPKLRGHVASQIAATRAELVAAGGDFSRLSIATGRGWRRVLRHNHHDCSGVKAVMKYVTDHPS